MICEKKQNTQSQTHALTRAHIHSGISKQRLIVVVVVVCSAEIISSPFNFLMKQFLNADFFLFYVSLNAIYLDCGLLFCKTKQAAF